MRREYTVKLKPDVGRARVGLCNLSLPDDFLMGHLGSGSIVEAELVKIVAPYTHGEYEMHESVVMQLLLGDHPYGTFYTHPDCLTHCVMSTKVPSRQGWHVVVGFYRHWFEPGGDSPQHEGSDRHVVVRVSSRPA